MSLVSLVFRNLTVLALVDRTLAGGDVRSSLLVPINDLQEQSTPVIAVFTDQAKAEAGDITGKDMLGAMGTVTLALESACMTRVPARDQQDVELAVPETDEGFEMILDVMHRQALAELQAGDSVWAGLWRDCCVRVRGIAVDRGASIEKGVKFAARRVEIHAQVLAEPVPGKPLTKFWTDVLAAFDADARVAGLSATLRRLLSGDPLPPWRQWQAELGISDGGIRAIGIAPFEGSETDPGNDIRPTVEIAVEDKSGQGEVITADADHVASTRGDGAPVELVEGGDG